MPIARKYRQIVPRARRPTLAGLILEKIAEAGEVLLDSFFPAKYPEARLWRKILGLDGSYEFKRATFASILSQLQAQSLIERYKKTGKSFWRITSRGKTALLNQEAATPARGDGRQRLVCFDIAERERAKREWLRGELLALGYTPLQKSVWLGDVPLPLDLLEALDELELQDSVHILQIQKEGTLRRSGRRKI